MKHLSPAFVEDMKAKLEAQRQLLQKELGTIAEPTPDAEFQAKFADYGRNDEDNAMEVADYVTSAATTKAAEEQLRAVDVALERIAQGTYGLTDDGQPIPEERLRANPAATTLAR